MYPWTIIYVFMAVFVLGSLPATYVLGTNGLYSLLYDVETVFILKSYGWTVIACFLLFLLTYVTGSHKNMRAFVRRSMKLKPEKYYRNLWIIIFIISLLLTGWMFVQTGYRLPVYESIGLDFTSSLQLRRSYEMLINQNIFNLHLYGLGVFSCFLAMFGIKRRKAAFLVISFLNILLISSFSLAKSSLANGFLLLLIGYSLVRYIHWRKFIVAVGLLFVLLSPWYAISGISENMVQSFHRIIAERILYGQWIALPFYFDIFQDASQPYGSVLPPYLKPLFSSLGYEWGEPPSRMVMRAIIGDQAADTGGAGVATTFFIGEAYALGGTTGIVFAIFIVAFEVWVLTYLFSRIGKNLFSTYLYAFMLFKFCMGIISGISAFILSGFTFLLAALVVYVFALHLKHPLVMSGINRVSNTS